MYKTAEEPYSRRHPHQKLLIDILRNVGRKVGGHMLKGRPRLGSGASWCLLLTANWSNWVFYAMAHPAHRDLSLSFQLTVNVVLYFREYMLLNFACSTHIGRWKFTIIFMDLLANALYSAISHRARVTALSVMYTAVARCWEVLATQTHTRRHGGCRLTKEPKYRMVESDYVGLTFK